MPLYESPAIVLRSMKLGEADKIVTFFTLQYGKLKAVAKGSAKPKNRFGGRLEPFTYLKIIAFGKEKADLLRLNSCDIIELFPAIKDDLDRLNRAYVSAELVDCCQRTHDANVEGFNLLLSMWRGLSSETDTDKQDLLLRLFELKYLSSIGYQPSFDKCVDCRSPITPPEAGFNPLKGGSVCRKCLASDPVAIRISVGAVKLMSKSLLTPIDKLARLSAGPQILNDIEKSVTEFVKVHIHRDLKSERFLKL